MPISGLQVINVGLPNESSNSDSLYTAFNKTKDNFSNLFACASPYNTFTGNAGIATAANSTTGTVFLTNTGVLSITPADGSITVTSSNGNVQIAAVGGGGNGSGTVTSIGILGAASNARITVSGTPIVSAGNITIDLATSGVTAGTYTYPTLTVDTYGRVTTIANGTSVGTVTSVGISPGTGIQVTGSPITTSGTMSILNTGVTRLSAGAGISLSGSNGDVTVSATTSGGTVTSVGVSSSTLTVSGSPIVSTGTITINIPSTISLAGNITGGNLIGVYANGNSNINIPSANGNVNISSAGNANILIVTGTGANITGTLYTTGSILSNGTAGIGYTTGAGSTVTQLTSRSTSVTINAITGAITLFSAAGTSSYTSFTVTNNKVAATDVIIVNQKSGTDLYNVFVTNVSAGSFQVTFNDVSGTTTEQPVFNFAVIKGVTS